MGKIAFVFPGQGAQKPGMGHSLYLNSAAAREIFEQAEAIRPDTKRQCFEGTDAELLETRVTQPCLYVVESAAAAALNELGIRADVTAGFSLGELSAIAYSNAVSFGEGLKLVMVRGELMQKAAEEHNTSMVAALKLSNEEIQAVAAKFNNVYPVNFNCPGQVSVSGAEEEMPEFCKAIKAAGGRTIPLKVRGAFHSPFMASASAGFAETLAGTEFSAPAIPLYSNYTGEVYGSDVRDTLSHQIDHPVYWERIIRGMAADGVDTFIEVGPGNTLCGFIKRIDPALRSFAVSEFDDLAAVCAEVK